MYLARLGRCIAIHRLWQECWKTFLFSCLFAKLVLINMTKKSRLFICPGFSQENNQRLPHDFNVSPFYYVPLPALFDLA